MTEQQKQGIKENLNQTDIVILNKKSIDLSRIREGVLNYVVPLVAVAVSSVLFFIIILPALKSGPKLNSELSGKKALTNVLSEKIRNITKLKDFANVVSEDSTILTGLLALDSGVPQLLTQIDQIANSSGLAITRLSYSFSENVAASAEQPAPGSDQPAVTASSGGQYKDVIVSMGAAGTYGQINSFLQNLEKAGRIVNVDNFRFSSQDEADTSSYAFSVVLRSPFLNVQSNAVTDDPITLDITDPAFLAIVDKAKGMKIYNISPEDVNSQLIKDVVKETSSSQL